MTLLGLDFDNTLVRYNKLFYQLAIEKGLIENSTPICKTAIRNFLRAQGKDEEFTLLQGEVYGNRILEAEPAEGMLQALQKQHKQGVQMVLVSHKTRIPYKGPAYDLHEAAWSWLDKHGFFKPKGLNWQKNQVYFENCKEAKIERIIKQRCTHYIDDLPEILAMLPSNINRILYSKKEKEDSKGYYQLRKWDSLEGVMQIR